MPEMAAGVELREITQDSLRAVLDLAVEPEQEPYVATNARSIAEGHFEPRSWFRAIYAGDDPVGFVMAFRDPPKEFWVWRFMIDAGHPGQGVRPPRTRTARRGSTAGRRQGDEAQLPPGRALPRLFLHTLRLRRHRAK